MKIFMDTESLEQAQTTVDIFKALYLRKYKVETKSVPGEPYSKVLILNDSFLLYVGIEEDPDVVCNAVTYRLDIFELSPNIINFQYCHKDFVQIMEIALRRYIRDSYSYTRFKGFGRKYWDKDTPSALEYIDKLMPELELRKRWLEWGGIRYNFLLIEYRKNAKESCWMIAYTTRNPRKYLNDMVIHYCRHRDFSSQIEGSYQLVQMLRSDKSLKGRYKLTKLYYAQVTENYREKDDVWRRARALLESLQDGSYRPDNMTQAFSASDLYENSIVIIEE